MNLVKDIDSIDLLLIGQTKNGKSALGNSLLRKEVFVSRGDASSVTFDINYEYSKFNGRILKIVDSPGICGILLNKKDGTEHIMKALETAIKINPKGYHAFLIVLKYGNRFTAEQSQSIMFLKQNFGKDFVKFFCIIVMTGGDNFEYDYFKKDKYEYSEYQAKFLAWCKNQNVDGFQDLLKECNNRIILFNNRARNEEILNEQVANLLQMVDNLALSGQRYTNAHFEAVKNARDQLMLEAQEPMIRDETMRDTSLILDRLKKIVDIEDLTERMKNLLDVSDSVKNLYDRIQKQDKGTGVLHELINNIGNIQSQIKKEMQCVITNREENERNRKLKVEKTRLHHIELQKIKEKADQDIKENNLALEKANKINEEKRKAVEAELKKQKEEREKQIEELNF